MRYFETYTFILRATQSAKKVQYRHVNDFWLNVIYTEIYHLEKLFEYLIFLSRYNLLSLIFRPLPNFWDLGAAI